MAAPPPSSTTSPSTIVHMTATSHLPIRLTASNFPVWRKQLQSTLIGLDLHGFIDGSIRPPPQFLDQAATKPNPDFPLWYRQDQILISAILGSCSETIQPTISSAATAQEAWQRLTVSYANVSRSRLISLKTRLARNPKGSRSIAEFLQDMRSIADELDLAQSPMDDEDLLVHILNQLGEEYRNLVAALHSRDTPLSYSELFAKLNDYERILKEAAPPQVPLMATANYTNRQPARAAHPRSSSDSSGYSRSSRFTNNGQPRGTRQPWANSPSHGTRPSSRSPTICQFCGITGHDTRECRKLTRFLKDHNITFNSPPTANATSSHPPPPPPTWLFDTGASHLISTDTSNLRHVSTYGGPDEILLGDGSLHGGESNAGGERK